MLEGLDLAEYFITSKATVAKIENDKNEINIIVKKSQGNKCQRCWKILDSKCERCEKISKTTTG